MSMSKEEDVFEEQKRRYQWYTGYRRDEEYEKNPRWVTDMEYSETDESEEDAPYSRPHVRFYDKFDPEHIWIKSDTTVDLMDNL